jgi:hypothetical protein
VTHSASPSDTALATDAERHDRLAGWLETTYMAQVATRDLAEDVLKSADTPALRATLEAVLADARRHEEASKALLAAAGREPARSRELAGVFTAKAREAVGNLYALSDGTFGTWRILHQLYLDCGNSLSAWAVAHRLAESAGAGAVAAIAAPVVAEKRAQHQQVLDALLAHAPAAELARTPV